MNRPKPKALIITQNPVAKSILHISVGTAEAERFIEHEIQIEEFGRLSKHVGGGYTLVVESVYVPEEIQEYLLSSFYTGDRIVEEITDELFTK